METSKGCKFIFYCILVSSLVDAVDRNNFKTCEQSSFCRRLRGVKPGETKYVLDLDSLQVSDTSVEADLINTEANVRLKFTLTALIDSTFRLTVDEVKPLHPRYKVEGALNGEPQVTKLELLDRSKEEVVVKAGNNKVVIKPAPFIIEFYRDEDLVMVINDRGLFTFEHLREKKVEGDVVQDLDAPAPQNDDPGAWEENFKSHHDSKPRGPEAIGLDIVFPEASHIYGIPEHGDRFALRSTNSRGTDPYRLYNLDVFEYELDSTMAIYGSVPVLYTNGQRGSVGVFWHNAAETWVDIANSLDTNVVSSIVNLVSGQKTRPRVDTHFMSESGIIDLFVFLGPDLKTTVRQYAKLTGTAPLPQYFTLAYHQSRWNYNDEDDVITVVENFDEHDLPLDVMWLDIEYTDGKKYFTWDSIKFKNPILMQQNLTATGRKLVVIIDPHIKREGGYFLHEEALANDYYVKTKDGNVYEGWCWPGSSSYLDFFDPKVMEYYSNLYALDKFPGSTNDLYLWNDMNEPSVFNGPEITMPKDCVHFGGWEHRHIHNVYGLYQTMGTYQGLLRRSNNQLRPFVLTRAHFSGSQRYAAVWTGDNAAEWSHLAASLPMCLSEAMAGISFCGADVGGFFNNPDEELLQRWYQTGAWLPFYRAHSHIDTKRREPFLYNQDIRTRIRTALRQRYAHLPLWYTLFWEHSRTGDPVIRPMVYEYPKTPQVQETDDQFLVGSSVMVHPITKQGVTTETIFIPGGGEEIWYDADDYRTFFKSGKIDIGVTMDKVPVYYRGGHIIPRKDRPRRASTLTHEDPFTLYVALNYERRAEGTLYIDDYQSFDYRTGKYLYIKFVFEDNKLTSSFIDANAKYATNAWLERVVILGPPMDIKEAKITSKTLGTLKLTVSYDENWRSLTIRKPGVKLQEAFSISFH